MTLIHKLCAGLLHPFRRLLRCDVHSDFSRTRWYVCRVYGEVIREEKMMDKNCGNCANYDRDKSAHTEACSTCISGLEHGEPFGPTNWKSLPMTNADRIRVMSDEELAAWLNSFGGGYFCLNKPECLALVDSDQDIPDEHCKACVMGWFQQPVKEEST